MGAATIRIFLADGTPLGIRLIEKSNWTGRAIDFARPDWVRARSRDDFGKPGVYVLTGVSDDGLARVYIGEADVLVTSKDENLNKAHVRYLESRLVALAEAAKRAKIENSTAPAAPALSEYDRILDDDAFQAVVMNHYLQRVFERANHASGLGDPAGGSGP